MLKTCESNRLGTHRPLWLPVRSLLFPVGARRAYSLAEDHVPAVLQAQVGGYGGSTVLHEQEDHRLPGLVAHHGHTVCERGEQGVKSLAPFTWARGKAALEKEHCGRTSWRSI